MPARHSPLTRRPRNVSPHQTSRCTPRRKACRSMPGSLKTAPSPLQVAIYPTMIPPPQWMAGPWQPGSLTAASGVAWSTRRGPARSPGTVGWPVRGEPPTLQTLSAWVPARVSYASGATEKLLNKQIEINYSQDAVQLLCVNFSTFQHTTRLCEICHIRVFASTEVSIGLCVNYFILIFNF